MWNKGGQQKSNTKKTHTHTLTVKFDTQIDVRKLGIFPASKKARELLELYLEAATLQPLTIDIFFWRLFAARE